MMFRRPTDVSSDESSDDEGPSEAKTVSEVSDELEDLHLSSTLSLSSNGNAATLEVPEGQPLPNSTYHSNMIMATLLEELARTRAAELLNSGTPGANFTRNSPDIQPVARRMFAQASRVLASNGILPLAFTGEDLEANRRGYLAGIDNIGLQALQDSDLTQAPGQRRSLQPANQLVLANTAQAVRSEISNLPTGSLFNLDIRRPSFPPMASPYADLQLTVPGLPTRSRYRSEFQQIKMLGKGGFGQVYHVKHHVDSQHYAVKRIPLSQKLSSKWHEAGHEETDNVLREIRTLARLEHCNIVRYFNAWVEEPLERLPLITSSSASMPFNSRKLLSDRPELAPRPNMNTARVQALPAGEDVDDIVFGDDSVSQGPAPKGILVHPDALTDNSPSSTMSMSMADSEIFSDGRSREVSYVSDPLEYPSTYVLHVQMSIHPLTLTKYLSTPSPTSQRVESPESVRHCFHLVPSMRILLGILCGLQYLHAMNIVHRDIKPGNILLSEFHGLKMPGAGFYDVGSCPGCPDRRPYHLNPRIGDFGLVAEVSRQGIGEDPKPFKAVGTEFYRPSAASIKAQVQEWRVDESLDVFALGIVLFEMLWHFDTKMERHLLLQDLSQLGRLPGTFAEKIDDDLHSPRRTGVGGRVATCILGMVDQRADRRWSCERVKHCIEEILRLEESQQDIKVLDEGG